MSIEFSHESGPQILVSIEVGGDKITGVKLGLSDRFRVAVSENHELAAQIFEWCRNYCDKKEPDSKLPFQVMNHSPFEQSVFDELFKIPIGKTMTYKHLAEKCRSPKAFRAVGGACGKNPWPFFVPCHRILCSDGSLGGFSQGLEIKRRLLSFES